MELSTTAEDRIAIIAKIAESGSKAAFLRQHLKDVIRGAAFQGSHRSGQFLDYIVKKALAGQCGSLKERVIGVELFGRAPTYDTGEDAIVRVTASDVRRRLLQHYGVLGASSQIRISLPLGSYIPEITWERNGILGQIDSSEPHVDTADASSDPVIEPHDVAPKPQEQAVIPVLAPELEKAHAGGSTWWRWPTLAILLGTLNLAFWGISWSRATRTADEPIAVLPWSEFLNSSHPLHLITSDPGIFDIQELTGNQISFPDYANHNYIQDPNKLSPEVKRLCDAILKGDKFASAADPPITADIAALAQRRGKKIDVRAARNIQFSDLKNDDNFIYLGSPVSNPWSTLFSDQLDFRFAFDGNSGHEIIRNIHPRQGELSTYLPTAPGWATGESYAIIAFVRNPDQGGRVLLIAGMNGEGTEAAGRVVTDLPQLTTMLRRCGLPPSSPRQDFEILLQLNTLAGSPHNVDMTACHILSGTAAH